MNLKDIELFEEFINRDLLRVALNLNENGSKTRVPDRFFMIESKIDIENCEDLELFQLAYKKSLEDLKEQKIRYDNAMKEISLAINVRLNGTYLNADLIYYQDQITSK